MISDRISLHFTHMAADTHDAAKAASDIDFDIKKILEGVHETITHEQLSF